jgi:hypothetical protein
MHVRILSLMTIPLVATVIMALPRPSTEGTEPTDIKEIIKENTDLYDRYFPGTIVPGGGGEPSPGPETKFWEAEVPRVWI